MRILLMICEITYFLYTIAFKCWKMR